MIAIKRLQSIMWILIVAAGALSAYLVSLRVATERNAVAAVERQIYNTRANIRYLEVEFSARSTMRQLAAWNARDVKYSVPGAGQYLANEQQLASLTVLEPTGPAYVAPPVIAAVAQADAKAAVIVPVKVQAQEKREDDNLATMRTVSLASAEPVRARPAAVAKPAKATATAEAAPRIVKLVDKTPPADRQAMRLAVLEETLLGVKPAGRAEASKAKR
jgi:hypothetical protein